MKHKIKMEIARNNVFTMAINEMFHCSPEVDRHELGQLV